jgi:ribosomal protein L11 methyltransferase
MPWLALMLELDAAAADSLGDALLEAGALSVSSDGHDSDSCRLSALIAVDADPASLLARAAAAAELTPVPSYRLEAVADDDWVRRSQAQFAPVSIGERLWVGPNWEAAPRTRAAVVRIDPGLAFGTGSHPTTRLMLSFIERRVCGGEGVLDYGCGSGILAIAAAKLGASRVDAVDSDPEAVRSTAENAAANHVAVHASAPEDLPPAQYDLVVSNILAQPLIMLAPLLAARTVRGGRLALSGILESQAAEVVRAYGPFLGARVSAAEDGWALVEGTRK